MFRADQEPVFRYRYLLDRLEEQYSPRGVWQNPIDLYTRKPLYDAPLPPVYDSGLHAFRHIDSQYLKQCMPYYQFDLLKGRITRIKETLNAVYFGRAENKFYVVINDAQDDVFARFIVRFHLIRQLDIKLIDTTWYDSIDGIRYPKRHLILDLRGLPFESLRKLSRWKLEYSPPFDGMILYDRVDQLIADFNSVRIRLPIQKAPVRPESKSKAPTKAQRIKNLINGDWDYKRYWYFLRDLKQWSEHRFRDLRNGPQYKYTLYFDTLLEEELVSLLKEHGADITEYHNRERNYQGASEDDEENIYETFCYVGGRETRRIVRITNAEELDPNVLLSLAKEVLE